MVKSSMLAALAAGLVLVMIAPVQAAPTLGAAPVLPENPARMIIGLRGASGARGWGELEDDRSCEVRQGNGWARFRRERS